MKRLRRLVAPLVIATAGTMPSTVVSAQDLPTVFHHGLNRSGQSMTIAGEQLRQSLRISPRYPSTSSFETYETQASEVASLYGTGTWTSVGHSNGGLVARTWNRQGGQHSRILTVGTPHRGAPIADRLLDESIQWDAFRSIQWLENTAQLYASFHFHDQSSGGIRQFMYWLVLAGIEVFSMPVYAGLEAAGNQYAAQPIIQQLATTSAFHSSATGINSPSNLAREQSAITHRGAVTSRWRHPYFLPCVAMSGDRPNETCVDLMNYGWGAAVALFDHYNYSYGPFDTGSDYLKWLHAWRWAVVANDIRLVDVKWLYWIGAAPTVQFVATADGIIIGYGWRGIANDAVVPHTSAEYPGATLQSEDVLNVSHESQRTNAQAIEVLRLQLARMGVPPRTPNDIASISISPSSTSLLVGGTATMTATTRNFNGQVVTGASIAWSSSDPGVATVSASGVVHGLQPGTISISASSGGHTAMASVTVATVPPLQVHLSGPQQITACEFGTWTAAASNAQSGVVYTWFVDGVEASTGQDYTRSFEAGSYTVSVRGTDSRGSPAWSSLDVKVSVPGGGQHFPCEG